MAGIFGFFDFTKEGKGVYPDEPPKGAIATFFAVLGRKFWKICTINLMYIVLSLPALVLAFFGSMYAIGIILPNLNMETLGKYFMDAGVILQEGITFEQYAASQLLVIYFIAGMLLTGLSLVIAGPVHAGVTYILRNYSREEHAFVWSDFREQAGKNFKQSLISSLISIAVTLLLIVNFAFYSSTEILGSELLRVFLRTIVVILFIGWCIIQMYLYPMMVTFNLTLKQLYKNCLMFTILRLPLNLLILLLSLVILLIIPAILFFLGYGFTVFLGLVWYLLIAFALNLLLTNFFAYRGLDKYMIQKIKAAEDMNEETEEDQSDQAEEVLEEPGQTVGENEKADDNKGMAQSPTQAGN